MLALLITLALSEAAPEEVAIEVPEAAHFEVSGDALVVEESSGEKTPLASPSHIALCGEELCEPLQALALPVRVSAGKNLRINGRGLIGGVWFAVRHQKLVAVNRLPLEEYLVATVGSEMPKSFPLEALKAQAVVSRTYALSKKLQREGALIELSSSTLDQVYNGLASESPETRKAVEATAGEVLVFQRLPIEAFFFSNCGGKTRDGKNVFGTDAPYLRSVACGYCNDAGNAHWTASLTLAELSRKLDTSVKNLRSEGTASDDRAAFIVAEPSGRKVPPEGLRKLLGYTVIKSPTFSVSCDGTRCHFDGRGAGHGVGMCQWGARGMALQQNDYHAIVAHYFPGASLKKLY